MKGVEAIASLGPYLDGSYLRIFFNLEQEHVAGAVMYVVAHHQCTSNVHVSMQDSGDGFAEVMTRRGMSVG